MGWVKVAFEEHEALRQHLGTFWNSTRDSIGTAVMEFNDEVPNALKRSDCASNGKFCQRLSKRDGTFIEVFLDVEQRELRTFKQPDATLAVCGFRVTADRKTLEYFEVKDGEPSGISVDTACQRALRAFLFTPFPKLLA